MGPPWGLQHMFPPHPIPGWRWTSCSFGYWAVICGWSDRSSWARWTCGTAGTRRRPLPPGRAQRAGQTARAGCESQAELPASVTQRATTTSRQPQTTTGSTDASPVHGPQPCYSPHVPENPARCARSSCAPVLFPPGKIKYKPQAPFQMRSRTLQDVPYLLPGPRRVEGEVTALQMWQQQDPPAPSAGTWPDVPKLGKLKAGEWGGEHPHLRTP